MGQAHQLLHQHTGPLDVPCAWTDRWWHIHRSDRLDKDIFPTLADLVFATAMPRCATGYLSANAKAEKLCTEGNSLVPLISDPLTPVKVAAYDLLLFRSPHPEGGNTLADVQEALKDQAFTPLDYKWSKADDWSKTNASSSRFMRHRRQKHGISLLSS